MHHSAYPVPKQAIEKFGREWTRPGNIVSNGAYMIQEWVPQGHIKAVKNPRFRDAAEVGIDTVFYYPVEEYGTELKQFRAGELHTTYDVPQEQIPMLEKDMAGQFRNSPYFGTYYYGINVTREPFKSNVRLRHALAMALDRDILVKQITKGGEIPAYGWVPPGVPGYEQQQVEWAGTDQKARVAEAKKILAEAGFDKGNPLKVELLYNTNDNHKKIAIAVAGMWKQFLGIETTLRNEEWKVYLESRNKKQFEVMRAAWIGDYVDPTASWNCCAATSGSRTRPATPIPNTTRRRTRRPPRPIRPRASACWRRPSGWCWPTCRSSRSISTASSTWCRTR